MVGMSIHQKVYHIKKIGAYLPTNNSNEPRNINDYDDIKRTYTPPKEIIYLRNNSGKGHVETGITYRDDANNFGINSYREWQSNQIKNETRMD